MANFNKKETCFICGKKIKIYEDLPMDATIFTSRGNYGSTVYDPMHFFTDIYLRVLICDECVRNSKGKAYEIMPKHASPIKTLISFRNKKCQK